MKDEIIVFLKSLQINICNQLSGIDGKAVFSEEIWNREEGGGGITRVIQDGNVFEKGGVNFSAVHGKAPEFLLNEKQHSAIENTGPDLNFFATGLSIVIHPVNPFVPIIHMNIRYFEMNDGTKWFGGGIDLTPHYVNVTEAGFFHRELKKICDNHHPTYYAKFKKWADDYFFIVHRKETRGIGGIFFDRLQGNDVNMQEIFEFWKDTGKIFAPVYTQLVNSNKGKAYNEENKRWQLLRRGRYVEFNLVYDKGTKFGLETNGRTESILMSLPKFASWEYNVNFSEDSLESKTLSYLKKGIDFINY